LTLFVAKSALSAALSTKSASPPITTAMILAAGRGERMRPLTDSTPKPLLMAGGKRLIEWQIERLVAAGVRRIVINHAWLGEQFEQLLGAGALAGTGAPANASARQRYGCELLFSQEASALETAGGIAKALPVLDADRSDAPFIVVSGDIYTDLDYSQLPRHLGAHAAHLVLVPNPPYHPNGDMGVVQGLIDPQAAVKHTYANVGVFKPSVFKQLDPSVKHKLFPWLYQQGSITGELFEGEWHNVGTPQQLADLELVLRTKH
jgi:N-acetyl-alpha-D-muramate 1-phosphate uridylyltransferase